MSLKFCLTVGFQGLRVLRFRQSCFSSYLTATFSGLLESTFFENHNYVFRAWSYPGFLSLKGPSHTSHLPSAFLSLSFVPSSSFPPIPRCDNCRSLRSHRLPRHTPRLGAVRHRPANLGRRPGRAGGPSGFSGVHPPPLLARRPLPSGSLGRPRPTTPRSRGRSIGPPNHASSSEYFHTP